ncbi:MAG TPA: hypothetical protein VFE14_08340 [Micromonosporaceae bacterium]|jgi:hypothetical protein|nr:hypothetical protein [Micromonosporaceae bacterium]
MRTDWRETMRDATDVALIGVAATLAALPLVTAGAAVASASAAIHDRCVEGSVASGGTQVSRFGRGLLPGLGAALVALGLAALVILDIRALVFGAVPGGMPVLLPTVGAAVALLGFAGLTVVEVGRRGARGWLVAARSAIGTGLRRPGLLAASAGVLALAIALGVVLPVTAPLLVGYALFALHAVARR